MFLFVEGVLVCRCLCTVFESVWLVAVLVLVGVCVLVFVCVRVRVCVCVGV